VILCLAQGLGVGRAPVAPGTVGSVLGVLWFLLLVGTGELGVYLAGLGFGILAAVPLCGAAERLLGRSDPPSVVLDEIVVVPLCFLPWVLSAWRKLEAMPPIEHFFTDRAWMPTLAIFVLFRVFDAAKPWPINRVQELPGGWGVTADDVLAAAATAGLSVVFVS
jgi:phosphatidylglycerophosphatase A